MNSSFESQQESLKRRWQDNQHNHHHHHHHPTAAAAAANYNVHNQTAAAAAAAAAGFYARLVSGAGVGSAAHSPLGPRKNNSLLRQHSFLGLEDDHLVSALVPQITVVLEGRSICQRISLDKHSSYQSLAKSLRQMFAEAGIIGDQPPLSSLENNTSNSTNHEDQLDLSNAIPGHLVAYEDLEDDLLLAGDLNWKDFVRVAKRIRIIPVKANSSRKTKAGGVSL